MPDIWFYVLAALGWLADRAPATVAGFLGGLAGAVTLDHWRGRTHKEKRNASESG